VILQAGSIGGWSEARPRRPGPPRARRRRRPRLGRLARDRRRPRDAFGSPRRRRSRSRRAPRGGGGAGARPAGVIADSGSAGGRSGGFDATSPVPRGRVRLRGPATTGRGPRAHPAGEVKLYRFTVPEGLRADEIALAVERSGLAGPTSSWRSRAIRNRPRLGSPSRAWGVLFPDTYAFARGVAPRAIAEAMVRRYREEWARAEAERKSGSRSPRARPSCSPPSSRRDRRTDERPGSAACSTTACGSGCACRPTDRALREDAPDGTGRGTSPAPTSSRLTRTTPTPRPGCRPAHREPGRRRSGALAPEECRDLYFVRATTLPRLLPGPHLPRGRGARPPGRVLPLPPPRAGGPAERGRRRDGARLPPPLGGGGRPPRSGARPVRGNGSPVPLPWGESPFGRRQRSSDGGLAR